MSERYSNKRQLFRRGGRFTKPPTLEQMGLPVADGEMQCAGCGHRWQPILTTGHCPICDSTDKTPNASFSGPPSGGSAGSAG